MLHQLRLGQLWWKWRPLLLFLHVHLMRPHHIILQPLVQGQFFANALLIHLLLHPLQLFYPHLQSLDPLPLHLIPL